MPKVIPFGDRILVKRRTIGEKLGSGILYASDETKDRPIDLAEVLYVPDLTLADKAILDNAENIITKLTEQAISGDKEALASLENLNDFIKRKSVKVGDAIFVSKYVGIDYEETESGKSNNLTLLDTADIIGLVVNEGDR